MPETVLVTICHGGAQADFELPAKLAISLWADALRDALRISFRGIRLENKKVSLLADNAELPADKTFEELGIYDGRILQLRLEECD